MGGKRIFVEWYRNIHRRRYCIMAGVIRGVFGLERSIGPSHSKGEKFWSNGDKLLRAMHGLWSIRITVTCYRLARFSENSYCYPLLPMCYRRFKVLDERNTSFLLRFCSDGIHFMLQFYSFMDFWNHQQYFPAKHIVHILCNVLEMLSPIHSD